MSLENDSVSVYYYYWKVGVVADEFDSIRTEADDKLITFPLLAIKITFYDRDLFITE